MSWLTRISAPSLAESASILVSRARSAWVAPVRSSGIELSPQTIRSGRTPPSLPPALNCAVSVSLASVRATGSSTTPGWTIAIVSVLATGDGGVSAKASGPAPAATAKAATPTAAAGRAGRAGRPAGGAALGWRPPGATTSGRSAPSTSTSATLAITRATLTSHTPPTAASASTAGCCHCEAPYRSHGPAEPLVGAHPLRDQPAARHHDEGGGRSPPRDAPGRSSLCTATANGDHIQPMTAPSSTSPGPISGAIQYSIAIR